MNLSLNEKGGSAVEFALILPVLILILFGIVEFSLIMYDKAVITNASREGARQGIVYRTDADGEYSPLTEDEIRTSVVNYLNSSHLLCLTNSPPVPSVAALPDTPPGMLTVRVTYRYDFLIIPHIPGVDMVDHVDLDSETVMRMEPSGS